jgi:hypothetical protein
MSNELSDYLVDALGEAKRLLKVKSDLGRIPLSKKQSGFKSRIEEMIDDWFEKEPNRYCESLQVEHTLDSNLDSTETPQGSQYNALSLDEGSVLLTESGPVDDDDIPF